MKKTSPLLDTSYKRVRHHIKSRLFIGLIIFTPFGVTLWIALLALGFITELLTKPAAIVADYLDLQGYVHFLVIVISLITMLLLIYFLGLASSTFVGKRLINAGERALRRIPGGEFLYETIKQIIALFSQAKEGKSQQRVVIIEYPRKGVYAVAFYSGLTFFPEREEAMVNVFFPTTPNPTTGFLMIMQSSEVWETNLAFAEASRFIMSGGVAEIAALCMRPFPIKECMEETLARQRGKEGGPGAVPFSPENRIITASGGYLDKK